ncbi:MAG: DUF2865 domain-containing protein [Bacteroidota bacterium]
MVLRLAPRWRALVRSRIFRLGVYLGILALLFVAAERAAAHLAAMALRAIPSMASAPAPAGAAKPKRIAMSVPPKPDPQKGITSVQGWRGYFWGDRDSYTRNRDGYERWRSGEDDDDDDYGERQRPVYGGWQGAYRTVCVRLCDGYYWPISFATTPANFEHDRDKCESSCGSPARLYVFRNDGDPEDMVDLYGRPYRNLKTAFLYRSQYDANCKCKADPWEQASKDQHRIYALEAARRKGDRAAAKDLEELRARLAAERRQALVPSVRSGSSVERSETPSASREPAWFSASPNATGEDGGSTAGREPPASRNSARDERMSLGASSDPGSRPSSARTRSWRDRGDSSP